MSDNQLRAAFRRDGYVIVARHLAAPRVAAILNAVEELYASESARAGWEQAAVAPFESTARFARGRIVAMLAEGSPLAADAVAARLPEEHRGTCGRYLEALAHDGIVALREGCWGLAEDG